MLVARFVNRDEQPLDINSKIYDEAITTFEALLRGESAGMSFEALRSLKMSFRFSQMRITCTNAPKKFELITTNDDKGKAVVEYFTSNSSSRPEACKSFTHHAWSDFGNCVIWADGKWGKDALYGNDRLYGIIAQNSQQNLFVSMGAQGRFSCNDDLTDAKLSFKLFIR